MSNEDDLSYESLLKQIEEIEELILIEDLMNIRKKVYKIKQQLLEKTTGDKYTVEEAAVILNVSKKTIRKHANSGKLKFIRKGKGGKMFIILKNVDKHTTQEVLEKLGIVEE